MKTLAAVLVLVLLMFVLLLAVGLILAAGKKIGGWAKRAAEEHRGEARADAAQYSIQSAANRDLAVRALAAHGEAKSLGDTPVRAKAIGFYRAILKDEPMVAGAHCALGDLLTDERKDDEAMVAFKMAHRLFAAQFNAACGVHPRERNLPEVTISISSSHAGMAEALGRIDRRRGLKGAATTAYETIFGRPPADTDAIAYLQTGGGSADGAEIGRVLNEKLERCSAESFPNARAWVNGYLDEMREMLATTYDCNVIPEIERELEEHASKGNWAAHSALVEALRQMRAQTDPSRGPVDANVAKRLDVVLAREAGRWLDSLPDRGIPFDTLALYSLPPDIQMEISRRFLAALPKKKIAPLSEEERAGTTDRPLSNLLKKRSGLQGSRQDGRASRA